VYIIQQLQRSCPFQGQNFFQVQDVIRRTKLHLSGLEDDLDAKKNHMELCRFSVGQILEVKVQHGSKSGFYKDTVVVHVPEFGLNPFEMAQGEFKVCCEEDVFPTYPEALKLRNGHAVNFVLSNQQQRQAQGLAMASLKRLLTL
jgi:hypothetical protein